VIVFSLVWAHIRAGLKLGYIFDFLPFLLKRKKEKKFTLQTHGYTFAQRNM